VCVQWVRVCVGVDFRVWVRVWVAVVGCVVRVSEYRSIHIVSITKKTNIHTHTHTHTHAHTHTHLHLHTQFFVRMLSVAGHRGRLA
jgi:hypothetical protein